MLPPSAVQQLGFDARRQRARLKLLGLSEADRPVAARLQAEVIRPGRPALVEGFFRWLDEQEEATRQLKKADRARMRERFAQHLLSLGVDLTSEAYFEARLQAGLTHVALEVPLALVLGGVSALERLIVERCLVGVPDPRPLLLFLPRLMGLEATLLADCYRLAQVNHLVRSLAEQMDTTRRYRVRARTDGLTGLANRAHLLEAGERLLAQAREQGQPFCAVMLDVDFFKRVNDTHGHPAGDAVLKAVAAQARGAVRGHDLVGRYGGEEFLILLIGASLQPAAAAAERLRLRIAGSPVVHEGTWIKVTVSQGVAQARAGEDLAGLVARADAALYQAKDGGRDRVVTAG